MGMPVLVPTVHEDLRAGDVIAIMRGDTILSNEVVSTSGGITVGSEERGVSSLLALGEDEPVYFLLLSKPREDGAEQEHSFARYLRAVEARHLRHLRDTARKCLRAGDGDGFAAAVVAVYNLSAALLDGDTTQQERGAIISQDIIWQGQEVDEQDLLLAYVEEMMEIGNTFFREGSAVA